MPRRSSMASQSGYAGARASRSKRPRRPTRPGGTGGSTSNGASSRRRSAIAARPATVRRATRSTAWSTTASPVDGEPRRRRRARVRRGVDHEQVAGRQEVGRARGSGRARVRRRRSRTISATSSRPARPRLGRLAGRQRREHECECRRRSIGRRLIASRPWPSSGRWEVALDQRDDPGHALVGRRSVADVLARERVLVHLACACRPDRRSRPAARCARRRAPPAAVRAPPSTTRTRPSPRRPRRAASEVTFTIAASGARRGSASWTSASGANRFTSNTRSSSSGDSPPARAAGWRRGGWRC